MLKSFYSLSAARGYIRKNNKFFAVLKLDFHKKRAYFERAFKWGAFIRNIAVLV